jgi:hypothetical protein
VSSTQLYFAIGLPCFTILVALVINIISVFDIKSDIREIRGDLKLLTGKVYELMGEKR